MQDEWPEYIGGEAEVKTNAPRVDLAEHWNSLCLTAAREHLSQRREQVRALRRRVAILAALALVEGGVLLGLLLRYLSG